MFIYEKKKTKYLLVFIGRFGRHLLNAFSACQLFPIHKKDSTYCFLKLNNEQRKSKDYILIPVFNAYLSFFLTFLRTYHGEVLSPQQLPRLKINHKFNWKFFRKNQPVNYWFRKDEIISMLTKVKFEIIELKTSGEILNLKNKNARMIYAVCKK